MGRSNGGMMAKQLPGKDTSLWIDTSAKTDYPEFGGEPKKIDVAIAGGGISGILTAWMLEKEGLTTAVFEKDRLVQNTTGNTTAKLTSQHSLIYSYITKEHGAAVAKAYAAANQQAIEDIDAVTRQLQIECDFERRDAYTYTENAAKLDDIHKEVEAAKRLGLPATFEKSCDLPFAIKGAIKFSQQAQFHPRKFLLAIAEDYVAEGGKIFENTKASDIIPGSPATLKTAAGDIKADFIVGATKYPFWRADIFENHTWTKLSYALGVKLQQNGRYPQGMYINFEAPIRTIRSHPHEGGEVLIFGGESHEMTKDYDKDEHYSRLISDVKEKFPVRSIDYRWIAGDVMPYDRLPYIGRYPGEDRVFVITGFHAWGLAWAMTASQMVADEIIGKKHPLSRILSPNRIDT